MIRILFVDDEPKILEGLRRMLRSQRHEWEMAFAPGGREALDMMEGGPFDVVVSDMKMPGMDGAQLLAEVKRLYPESIRLILSGQADRESILRVVGSSHQFLSKPCEPEVLKATVDRAFSLRRVLEDHQLMGLVSQMETLPSLPKLYEQIVEELNKPEPSIKRVGDIVESDMGMSAKVLKLVNSAFFGLRHSVSSVEHAVAFLGLDTISTLVLSNGVFEQFEDHGSNFSIETLWSHSVRTGRFALAIAKFEEFEKEDANHAFTAGMLHEAGKLVLASNVPEEYAEVVARLVAQDSPTAPIEREILHATHGEVGAYLMGLWGLPDTIVEAVAFHVAPGECPATGLTALTIVHVADVLANEASPAAVADDSSHIDHAYLDAVGVGERWHEWRDLCAELGDTEEAA